MSIDRAGRRTANLAVCVAAAGEYGLSAKQARAIVDAQIDTVLACWADAAEEARLRHRDAEAMMGRQVLNPAAVEGYAPAPLP